MPTKKQVFPSQLFLDILDLWKQRQTGLVKVFRWNHFSGRNNRWRKLILKIESAIQSTCLFLRHPLVREQNCLQHTDALSWLMIIFVNMTKHDAPNLDYQLLLSIPPIHDEGEDILNRDIAFTVKNNGHDLAEYNAFRTRYICLEKSMNGTFENLHRAFLLQFCLNIPENFSSSTKQLMTQLAKNHNQEARIFNALEHIDYILFALEQYICRGHIKILYEVVKKSMPILDDHAKHLPTLKKYLWTEEVQQNFTDFLKKHRDPI